tara:strand:- start:13215 stop:14165 length:951 start_codon:yes stop_codon:yes gene_type:complete
MNNFVIILGEPNSINSEILAKSKAYKSNAIIIGNYQLLKSQLKILKINRKLKKIKKIEDVINSKKALNILDVPLKFKHAFLVNHKESKNYVRKCFNLAHKLCLHNKIKGMINCPINKKNIFKNENIGVTEFLARKNKVNRQEAMIIYNKKLSVVPLTTHIKIKKVSKFIKKDLILKKIKTINNYYFKYFKKKPRIAVLGLNPHNYEFKKDSEEVKVIKPAIIILKKKYKISGPYSSDTIFMKENLKKFDVIVGMYHDQVLPPFKAIFGFDAVNITLGLPYIRMSPDHGVANDKIKLNISNPESINKCIDIISKLVK